MDGPGESTGEGILSLKGLECTGDGGRGVFPALSSNSVCFRAGNGGGVNDDVLEAVDKEEEREVGVVRTGGLGGLTGRGGRDGAEDDSAGVSLSLEPPLSNNRLDSKLSCLLW